MTVASPIIPNENNSRISRAHFQKHCVGNVGAPQPRASSLGTSVDVWLNLQLAWDLYEAMNSPKAKEIERLEKIA